jgi:nucleotide-binding universal stress UspA family protein
MTEVPAFPSIPTRILLPIDFSASSRTAFEMATNLARHFHAELYLVHVIPAFPTTTFRDFAPEEAFLQEARTHAEQRLIECQAVLAFRGVSSRFSVETDNDIVENIMIVIEREHIDMVVISTHGLSGWHPQVFGSIAEKVVKLVQCPILLLHSEKPKAGKSPKECASEFGAFESIDSESISTDL